MSVREALRTLGELVEEAEGKNDYLVRARTKDLRALLDRLSEAEDEYRLALEVAAETAKALKRALGPQAVN